ncbi:hypothetical protein B0H19DRAFT_1143998 [Mycena capillaripes]|nr:hypothetical protein B0H19DRAFT_1143998 [Mycena capillaripes]
MHFRVLAILSVLVSSSGAVTCPSFAGGVSLTSTFHCRGSMLSAAGTFPAFVWSGYPLQPAATPQLWLRISVRLQHACYYLSST